MRRLLLAFLVVFTAVPARAQAPEGRGAVHVAVGYFDGGAVYGDVAGFALSPENLSVAVGAEAHVLRRPAFTGTLGATFRMASSDLAAGDGDEALFTSGFRPQHLDLYGRLAGAYAAATAGFVLDLGPRPFEQEPVTEQNPDAEVDFLNSDMQHAVRLGLSGEAPVGRLNLHASLDGFLTLPYSYTTSYRSFLPDFGPSDEVITIDGEIDFGDQFVLRAGGAYGVGVAEIGLDLAYAVTTSGEGVTRSSPSAAEPEGTEIREVFEPRYVLSLIPYVTVAPEGSPFALTLAAEASGGAYSDHVPFGLTLAGDNQPKVRLPLSLRVRYGF